MKRNEVKIAIQRQIALAKN